MTATVNEQEPEVEILPESRQCSLIDLPPRRFHELYDKFALLLLTSEGKVAVAGCTTWDKAALKQQFLEAKRLDSLDGYVFGHGPKLLARAAEALSDAEASSAPARSR